MERKLAAVLAADVVGYSNLMNVDEISTLTRLKDFKQRVIQPILSEFGGRLIKEMGDGYLVEFSSIFQCMDCAYSWQRHALEEAATTEPNMSLQFRIGINVGEVLFTNDDVFGDGVNIAARLEAMAEPGGILVSGSAYDQVMHQTSFDFDDFGFRKLTNIPQPVRTYSARLHKTDSDNTVAAAWPFLSQEKSKNPKSRGGCLCGAVQYEVWGEAAGVGFCHCRFCQLALGAPLNAWAAFKENDVKFVGEPAKIHKSSEIALRGFCSNCGTSIFTLLTGDDGGRFYSIRVATLDDPQNYPPTLHFGVESKIPWLEIKDDLPRICTSDDPGLSGLWSSVGQPKDGPKLGTAADRAEKRKTNPL